MKTLIALVVVVSGLGLAARGCANGKPAPDEQLVTRIGQLCDIARANVKTPNKGVIALGVYLGDHAGDMAKHLVDTVAIVSQITDDKKLEARAVLARERWSNAVEQCYPDFARFADAVESDPEASARVERFHERLQSTIDIIFSGASLRDLPRTFERYLTAQLPEASTAR